MKVVCCTMYSSSNQLLADITIPNLFDYAQNHGYEIHTIRIPDGEFHYKKHEAFKELFKQKVDIIFYKDIDGLITNLTIPITNFIDKENDFFITKDYTEINGGSLITLNTVWSRKFNDFILSERNNFNNEQEVYVAYQNDARFKDKIKILPQNTINSYLYDKYVEIGKQTHDNGQWEEGDFLLHLPGMTLDMRISIMNEYKNKIVK